MSRTLVILVVAGMGLWGSALSVPGQEEDPPNETAAVEPTDDAQVQEAFELDMPSYDRNRDPFWPVNYTPEALSSTQQTVQATTSADGDEKAGSDIDHKELLKKKIAIRGIMKIGDRYVAMINDQPAAEGEMVSVLVDGVTHRYLVRTLTEDNVVLEPVVNGVKPGS